MTSSEKRRDSMKKINFEKKDKKLPKILKKVASIALAGSLTTLPVFALSSCSNPFTTIYEVITYLDKVEDGVYKLSQLSQFSPISNPQNAQQYYDNLVENNTTYDGRNIVSDETFAEMKELVHNHSAEFVKDLFTVNDQNVNIYNNDISLLKTLLKNKWIKINYDVGMTCNFGTYVNKILSDYSSNIQLTEKMLYEMYLDFTDLYLNYGSEVLYSQFTYLSDLTDEELDSLKAFLKETAIASFDCYFQKYKDRLSGHSVPFSLNNFAYACDPLYKGANTSFEEMVNDIFNERITPDDIEVLDGIYTKYWIEAGDEVFLENFGYKYSDCLALTTNQEVDFYQQ